MNFNKAKFLISYGLSSQIPPSSHVEIAFAGRSNVGKSSTINKLFNRKGIARVSCVPGKTATINFYDCDNVHFVDLPGYGYAKVAKTEKQRWSELIEGYFADDRAVRLVVSLIDMRHPPSVLDLQMINYLIEHEFPFIVVMTKSDKLNKTERSKRLEAIKSELPHGDELTIIPFSSETGEGVDELRDVITQVSLEPLELDEEMEEVEENLENLENFETEE